MIPQKFIDEVQARTDIGEVISSYIPLKRAGRNFKALCPFHGEKTPSFMISPQKQIFHCFGCGQGGTVIQFIMQYEKATFVEAIEILARRLGLEVPYQRGERQKLKTILYDAVEAAAQVFNENLLGSTAAPVMSYLNKRGVSKEVIDKFRIGYAPGRNALTDNLRKRGFSLEVLEKASLVIAREGGFRDLFADRVMFPVCDSRSRVVGFGARSWRQSSSAPKYINSLENPLYSKRQHLFGLNFAKDHILKEDYVVVVEGYLDMIIPFMAGVKNIVASLGTALTLEQIRSIRRYTTNIVLVFDSDKAGQLASLRALDLLLENDLEVKVAKMLPGFDPDSLVRKKGKDFFLQLIREGVDFFDYKMSVLKDKYSIESIEGKNNLAKDMFATINKLSSEIKKYEYIKKLADKLRVKEEILIAEFRRVFPSNSPSLNKKAAPVTVSKDGPVSIAEKVLIKFMLTNSKAFSLVKKNLSTEDFGSSISRKVVSYFLMNYSGAEELCSSKVLGEVSDKEIGSFVSEILIDDGILLDKELFRSSMWQLRKKRILAARSKLKEEIKEAEAKGDAVRLRMLISKYGKINSEARNG